MKNDVLTPLSAITSRKIDQKPVVILFTKNDQERCKAMINNLE